MAGHRDAAVAEYRLAAGLTMSIPERNYLISQAVRISEICGGVARDTPSTD
jgi:hypothetical protein